MKATVPATWKEQASAKELALFVSQARAALNLVYSTAIALTTTATSTLTTMWTSPALAPNARVNVIAYVTGTDSTGAIYATFKREAQFKRPATGVAVQQGATLDLMTVRRSGILLDCAFLVGADSTIAVQVNDGGYGTVDWDLWIEARA